MVIGNSPLLKSYSAKAPVMYLELAVVPSLYLGRACSDQTPSSMILVIFSLNIVSAFVMIFLFIPLKTKYFLRLSLSDYGRLGTSSKFQD